MTKLSRMNKSKQISLIIIFVSSVLIFGHINEYFELTSLHGYILLGLMLLAAYLTGNLDTGSEPVEGAKKVIFEFGSKDIQELLLANKELLPKDVQKSIELGAKINFSVKAEHEAFYLEPHAEGMSKEYLKNV
jgi:hypothetical protein